MRGVSPIGRRGSYYAVSFTYKVDGIAYRDATASMVEVQPNDKFAIRYNPDNPAENNSLASECDRPWFNAYLYLFAAVMIGLLLFHLFARYYGHN